MCAFNFGTSRRVVPGDVLYLLTGNWNVRSFWFSPRLGIKDDPDSIPACIPTLTALLVEEITVLYRRGGVQNRHEVRPPRRALFLHKQTEDEMVPDQIIWSDTGEVVSLEDLRMPVIAIVLGEPRGLDDLVDQAPLEPGEPVGKLVLA